MTQEDKELLLRDLCARLPYGVKVQRTNPFYKWRKEIEDLSDVFLTYNSLKQFENHIEHLEIRPYLRPMSSMTKDESNEYENFITNEKDYQLRFCNELVFYNRYHFDYRGLIPKGLALEAPKGMYKK